MYFISASPPFGSDRAGGECPEAVNYYRLPAIPSAAERSVERRKMNTWGRLHLR